jgi:hypothetical protein
MSKANIRSTELGPSTVCVIRRTDDVGEFVDTATRCSSVSASQTGLVDNPVEVCAPLAASGLRNGVAQSPMTDNPSRFELAVIQFHISRGYS